MRQEYTFEQKQMALDLADNSGIKKASGRTGIPLGTLKRWVVEEKQKKFTFCRDCIYDPEDCHCSPEECQQDPLAKIYFKHYKNTYGLQRGW